VDRVCLSFESSRHYLKFRDGVMIVTGNPVRDKVLEAMSFKRTEKERYFNLLVCGGSQGASIFSQVVPDAVNLLPNEIRQHVNVVQQVRDEDEVSVRDAYRKYAIDAEIKPFFDDLERRMVDCHLLIGRSGASTVNEANLLGRAAIFVPLAKLADGHQVQNARIVENADAGILMHQVDFTAANLANLLKELIQDKERLIAMEEASLKLGAVCATAAKSVAEEVALLAGKDILLEHEEPSKLKKTEENTALRP